MAGDFVAPMAQLARGFTLIPLVSNDREAPQRLREHRLLPATLSQEDRRFVMFDRLGDASRSLTLPSVEHQVGGWAQCTYGVRPGGAD